MRKTTLILCLRSAILLSDSSYAYTRKFNALREADTLAEGVELHADYRKAIQAFGESHLTFGEENE